MNTADPDNDPIVAEVRRIREENAEKHGFDLKRIIENARQFGRDWPAGNVSFDPNDPKRNR
jgi:hypothetical protein